MIQPSASKTALLLACAYSFDPTLSFEREQVGEAARYGSAFHDVLADVIRRGMKNPDFGKGKRWPKPSPNLIACSLKRYSLPRGVGEELYQHVLESSIVLKRWLEKKNPWSINLLPFEVETAYAYNPFLDESRKIALPTPEEHFYEDLRTNEIAGTTDLLAQQTPTEKLAKDSLPTLILDHKTGFESHGFETPHKMEQLLTLALATRADLGAILHADRRGLPVVHGGEFDTTDLTNHRVALKKALKSIGDGTMRPWRPGMPAPWEFDYCSRCPAQSVCPTQNAPLIASATAIVESTFGGIVKLTPGQMSTVEQVGKYYSLSKKLRTLLTAGDKRVRELVVENPEIIYETDDGKILTMVERTVESLSKTSIVEGLGKTKGEEEIARLRGLGATKESTRMELHAVENERVSR